VSRLDDIKRSLANDYHEPGDTPTIAMAQAQQDIRYLLERIPTLTDLVSDEEARLAIEIYRRQDALNDPYAIHRAIEEILRMRRKLL